MSSGRSARAERQAFERALARDAALQAVVRSWERAPRARSTTSAPEETPSAAVWLGVSANVLREQARAHRRACPARSRSARPLPPVEPGRHRPAAAFAPSVRGWADGGVGARGGAGHRRGPPAVRGQGRARPAISRGREPGRRPAGADRAGGPRQQDGSRQARRGGGAGRPQPGTLGDRAGPLAEIARRRGGRRTSASPCRPFSAAQAGPGAEGDLRRHAGAARRIAHGRADRPGRLHRRTHQGLAASDARRRC